MPNESRENKSVREALEEIYPHLFGEFERKISESEEWLGILNMPLHNALDSRELEELLSQWGNSFVQEGQAELLHYLNPVQSYRRNTIPATEIQPTQVEWIVQDVLRSMYAALSFYFHTSQHLESGWKEISLSRPHSF